VYSVSLIQAISLEYKIQRQVDHFEAANQIVSGCGPERKISSLICHISSTLLFREPLGISFCPFFVCHYFVYNVLCIIVMSGLCFSSNRLISTTVVVLLHTNCSGSPFTLVRKRLVFSDVALLLDCVLSKSLDCVLSKSKNSCSANVDGVQVVELTSG